MITIIQLINNNTHKTNKSNGNYDKIDIFLIVQYLLFASITIIRIYKTSKMGKQCQKTINK